MLVYVHTTRIYVRFIRRKQLLVTAWYAVMSYGAESACSRDLLRSIILHDIYIYIYRISLTSEEVYLISLFFSNDET